MCSESRVHTALHSTSIIQINKMYAREREDCEEIFCSLLLAAFVIFFFHINTPYNTFCGLFCRSERMHSVCLFWSRHKFSRFLFGLQDTYREILFVDANNIYFITIIIKLTHCLDTKTVFMSFYLTWWSCVKLTLSTDKNGHTQF